MYSVHIPSYRQKFEHSSPDWLESTVKSELDFFKKHPITQRALAATYERIISHGFPRTHYMRRYRIIGNRIYAYSTGISETETDRILRTLARLSDYPGIPDLPNVDFMVNHNDGMPMNYDPPGFWITENQADQAPVFSGGKREDVPYVVLIPHRTPMAGWMEMTRDVRLARSPWRDKIRSACWRGNIVLDVDIINSADQELLEANARAPRSLISSLSLRYPDLINAGFYESGNMDWIPSEALRNVAKSLIKGRISYPEHIRYAYLPVLDGAMLSWGGYEWRLLSQSLVLKPDSPNIGWFERGLQPYIHYVPIHENLDDLITTIRWARAHDDECQKIASNGADFALEHLMIEGLYFFIFRMLQEYEKCQVFDTKDLLEECENDPNWTRVR
jgi:hypothetical protein